MASATASRRKPRIRTVLLAANLALLVAPLGGLWLLKVYESALVRQTETELIGQAAVIAAVFRAQWAGPDAPLPPATMLPRPVQLDLARDPVLPPPFDGIPGTPPDPRAAAIGRELQPVLAEAQRVTLAAMRVLDRQGVVVASSREELGLSLAAQPEVAAALQGQPISVLRARVVAGDQPRGATSLSRSGSIRVFVAHPVLEQGEVIGAVLLSRTPPGVDQALYGKRWHIAGLVLVLLLVAGALAFVISYTVSRPIRDVADRARLVAAGGRLPPGRVRRSAVREADELSAAIQAMAGTLQHRADYIGGFAAEVSHEFKTPLAALRGALELLQDEMPEADRARFLAQAQGDVERLDRLVRRLLELARAEAPPPRDGGRCNLRDVQADLPDAEVAIPAETLRAVLGNLRDNTRQHAGPGAVSSVTGRIEGDRVILRVADNGRGISAANAARVFERFFTTARDTGGTGLGLPIVRSMLEAAGGSIALVPAETGTCFEISLPVPAPHPR
ncbi:HAMP domain-containing protein [Rhodovarius crocodyli]|uniref:histidine kinase n=1 Tax=Rhodovarius crocodyli TaxID=1979269 RepID=A0A437MCJ6_9PROT|nr:ATP-binding protein [Rhodovarius crocodyli]RVT95348.1 HAMP domain-containing protein [Rhodovarius crocodyli]